MIYKFIEKEAFQIIGVKRTYNFRDGENDKGIPHFWKEVLENGINKRLVNLNNGNIKGVLGVCIFDENQKKEGLMDYWIATAHNGEIPNGLLSYTILASKWVVFEVHGPMPQAIQDTWEKIYSEWFPTNPYNPTGTHQLEVYTSDDASNEEYYSEIWIPLM